jgi:delta(3,5)-delta(2,4)-dienoyl-CoA isomerase
MWREIGNAFGWLGTQGDGCRCILLTGSGKASSAGIDTSDPSFFPSQEDDVDAARKALSFRPKILEMQRCFTAVENCPVPVVAALHGPCIGAGIDLACCADIRLCSPSTMFSIREVRLGLAADVGTLQRLPKIVGHTSRVREICLTGEDFDAVEASRIGFVSRISQTEGDLWPMAIKLCKRIASNSPVAVAGTKLSLNYSRDHTVQEGLAHIASHNSMALLTDDLVASFTAAASGNDPTFANLWPHSRL